MKLRSLIQEARDSRESTKMKSSELLKENVSVSTPLGSGEVGDANITISLLNDMGDVNIKVVDDNGKTEEINVLEDHIPDIIDTLTQFYKKIGYQL